MKEPMVIVENVKKEYRLGAIGGTTLRDDIHRWVAKARHKEDPTLKVGQSSADYGKKFMALNGVTFSVEEGEAVGIIGHNGAGKSTLLKLLCRVTAPSEGRIVLNGRIASMLEVGTGFHPELTGRENIYMNGAILGMTKAEIDEKVDEIINFSECRKFIDTPVKRYSSGMYVKLAFSVAAHLDSEIMIMDEVLAVGDMKFQQKCLRKMKDAAMQEGRTVLYVSHNMNTIKQLCNRCIVLKQGQIIFDGNVDQAIKIYLGEENESLAAKYDLENTPRPPYGTHGTKLRISSFEFCDREYARYLPNEKIRFRMKMMAKEKLENLRILYTLNYENGEVVGTTWSNPFANCSAGEKLDHTFSFDTTGLAKGKYYFEIDVLSANEFSGFESYDHPLKRIFFEIVEGQDNGLTWKREYGWGSLKLPPIIGEN